MCGRFEVDAKSAPMAELLSSLPDGVSDVKTGDVFPANTALTLIMENGQVKAQPMLWGFPRWDGKGLLINARSETAPKKTLFSPSLAQRPAIIPATGFYEWQNRPDHKKKVKFIFRDPQGELLYMGGFWNAFGPEQGIMPEHFMILTTAANASAAPIHDRMPLLLRRNELEEWLAGGTREHFFKREQIPLKAFELNGS